MAAALIVALLGQPRWRQWQRDRIRAQAFPASWRRILRRRVPYVAKLPPPLQKRLRQDMQVFLAEKRFIGCAGVRINDDIRVTIAAQACLLLLNKPHDYFAALRQILVYPGAFMVDRVRPQPGGVLQEHRQVLSGESWTQGQVILSWEDTVEGARHVGDGRNVVIHEFAHQLDQATGAANGAPALPSKAAYARWAGVMAPAFQRHQWLVAQGVPTLLGDYAATDPAEFFAVSCEVFFERAPEMADQYPQVFEALSAYFGVDPRLWH